MRPLEQLNRFIRLARVFLEGRGLPFLGAGISATAAIPIEADWEPTVDWMVEALITRCLPRLLNDHPEKQRQLAAYLGENHKVIGVYPFEDADVLRDRLGELVCGRLGLLCEGLNILEILDHASVVAALRIEQYAKLLPTPAHYYIALLVAESLVNETITTNYDCCLERAVNHVRGDEGNGQPNSCLTQPVVSIKNLQNYRKYAARRLSPTKRSVTLRVYKINGCAGTLSRNSAHACHILLTERQLQHMDDRAWARDLLRDRARAKALVFSGFGSDEPQVKFTLQRLQEEFSADGQAEDANTLWVHAYSEQLSSTQLDILKGFWGHSGRTYERYYFSGSDTRKMNKYAGLIPNDAPNTLPANDPPESLPADLFWQTLFQVVFLGLIEIYTRAGAPGWFFLGQLDSPPRPVARKQRLHEWLDPGGVGELLVRQQGDMTVTPVAPLARVHSLLGFQKNIQGNGTFSGRGGIPLCFFLRALEGRLPSGNEPTLAEVYYKPLVRQVKPILALLCLACFCRPEQAQPNTSADLPFEVKYAAKGQPEVSPPVLLFNSPGLRLVLSTEQRQDMLETVAVEQANVTLLVGYLQNGAPFFPKMSEEWAAVEVAGADTIRVRRLAPVSIQDILFICRCGEEYQNQESDSPGDDENGAGSSTEMSREVVALLERRIRSQTPGPPHHATLKEQNSA